MQLFSDDRTTTLEHSLTDATPYLLLGLVSAIPLLAVPTGWSRFGLLIAHLSCLVALATLLATRLAGFNRSGWFADRGWSGPARRLASDIVVIVVVTGVAGLVTLATAAALRFDPSLQFLQLLSSLDIAWVVAAVIIGAGRLWGTRAALVAGTGIGILCVLSIWNYLRVVGLTDAGGWLVDGGELRRLVLPFDTLAAMFAISLVLIGIRRAA